MSCVFRLRFGQYFFEDLVVTPQIGRIADDRLPEQVELPIETVKTQGLIMTRLHLALSLSLGRSVSHHGPPCTSRCVRACPATSPASGLIKTSRRPCHVMSPLDSQVDRLGLPSGRAGDGHQALGFEVGQAVAQVALVVPQGLHQVRMTGGHGALGAGLLLGQPDKDAPLQAGQALRSRTAWTSSRRPWTSSSSRSSLCTGPVSKGCTAPVSMDCTGAPSCRASACCRG